MVVTNIEENANKIKSVVEGLYTTNSSGERLLEFSKEDDFLAKKVTVSNEEKPLRTAMLLQMPEVCAKLDLMRTGTDIKAPIDITLGQYVKDWMGFSSVQDFLQIGCGINNSEVTLASFATMADMPEAFRWLRQEVFLDIVRLGLQRPTIYTKLISATIPVKGFIITTPFINESDAMPVKLGELESIPVGSVSLGQKQVGISKYGRGFEISDELKNIPLNLVGIYLDDFGIQMTRGLDAEALRVMLNGEQANGSASAASVGVTTAGVISYADLLLFKIRMSRMSRTPKVYLMDEATSIALLSIPEVKGGQFQTKIFNFTLENANIPTAENIIVHSAIPTGTILMVDAAKAMIKLDKQALRVETERVPRNQADRLYCSFQTGFATTFRDGRVIMNTAATYSASPFPAFLDPSIVEKQAFLGLGAK